MLLPDHKNRIKMKEIFTHPWVVSFEKEYKEEKINKHLEKTENNSPANKIKINSHVIIKNDKNDSKPIKLLKSGSNTDNFVNKGRSPLIVVKEESKFKLNRDSLNSKSFSLNPKKDMNKANKTEVIDIINNNYASIDTSFNDFSILSNYQQERDNLFDSVLDKVSKKNGDKRKKKYDKNHKTIDITIHHSFADKEYSEENLQINGLSYGKRASEEIYFDNGKIDEEIENNQKIEKVKATNQNKRNLKVEKKSEEKGYTNYNRNNTSAIYNSNNMFDDSSIFNRKRSIDRSMDQFKDRNSKFNKFSKA